MAGRSRSTSVVVSGVIWVTASGLRNPDAILASSLLGPIPMDAVSPLSSLILRRISSARVAGSFGPPRALRNPRPQDNLPLRSEEFHRLALPVRHHAPAARRDNAVGC